jgi:hypothetical protein
MIEFLLEIDYRFEMFKRRFIEFKLKSLGFKRNFYCQSEIEGNRKCKIQCYHCKIYYKPLEDYHNRKD